MKPLVAKEIRLLLPAYGAALLLAIIPVWLPTHNPASAALYTFWLGVVMLSLSSFGREFGLRTFPFLLAQPVTRSRIWWTKIALLAIAIVTVFGAWCLSCEAWLRFGPVSSFWLELMGVGGAVSVVAFAGGLWTTLLLRQVTAAFWFIVLVPAAIIMAINDRVPDRMVFAVLGLYSAAGFLWAWWLFLRAQETGWTGGRISFSNRRSSKTASYATRRTPRAIPGLFWKELQLHHVGLAGMAGLFVLHLGVVWLRRAGHHAFGETMRTAMSFFGVFWVAAPLLVGSPSVAEERRLGTFEGQLCLPIASRIQFAIKLLFAVVFGGLLSAVLLWIAEGLGSALRAGSDIDGLNIPFNGEALLILVLIFMALSLIAFYASTLTRNILQALGAAVITAMLMCALVSVATVAVLGRLPWEGGNLISYIAYPTLLGTFLWLSYGNFRRLSENWRLWLRNLLGLTGALALIIVSTAAIHSRAWELVMPLEPVHAAARLAGPKPVALNSESGNTFVVLLPDGRLWVNRLSYDPAPRATFFGKSIWSRVVANPFIEGSNWVSAAVDVWETAAIRSDGTLWVSEKPFSWGNGKPPIDQDKMARYGDETNWLSVVRDGSSLSMLFLLKKDGTLWWWGTNHFKFHDQWSGLRAFAPYRIGTESDWARIISTANTVYAWKQDGRAYERAWLPLPARGSKARETDIGPFIEPQENLDDIGCRSLTELRMCQAAVLDDGSLWVWGLLPPMLGGVITAERVQIGKLTNWLAVALSSENLVALKADGSLWQWGFIYSQNRQRWVVAESPVRLGIHSDWIALGSAMDGIVSLAADGSLWHWWLHHLYQDPHLLAASRRPTKIENIFDRQE